jgi:hypothetical protein
LVREYVGWWRFWCKDVKTRPIELPTAIAVMDDDGLEIESDGDAYLLRWARVEVVDAAWRTHVCPHRWRGERCPPRPADPEGWGGLPL